MNNQMYFRLETTMDPYDYRRFLYLATFKRNKSIWTFAAVLSFAGGLLLTGTTLGFSIVNLFVSWAFMLALVLAAIGLKIEYRSRQRVKNDHTGVFGSMTTMEFYDDYMTMESPVTKGKSQLDYEEFYQLLECKQYFVFYYSSAQATILRKRDFEETDMMLFREFITGKFAGKYKRM